MRIPFGTAAVAAVMLAGLGTSANAQVRDFANSTNNTQATASNARAATAESPERRICVRMELSGSRITREVCRTRAEWERTGGLSD